MIDGHRGCDCLVARVDPLARELASPRILRPDAPCYVRYELELHAVQECLHGFAATSIASIALSESQRFGSESESIGSYFQNTPGMVAVVLSLSSNVIATTIIGIKTW